MKHLLLCLFIFFSAYGCGSTAIATWSGKIFSYQTNDFAFERKQDNEIIPYNSIAAQGMICMNAIDFNDFLNTYIVTPTGGTKIKTPAPSPKNVGN